MGSVEVGSPIERDIVSVVDGMASVDSVYLFGSQVHGAVHDDSDVDVAVLFDRGVLPSRTDRYDARLRLMGAIIGVLHRNDVDLVVLNDAPPLLARAIVRSGRRLHCRDEAADIAFRRDVQLRAADLEPFIRRMRRTILESFRT